MQGYFFDALTRSRTSRGDASSSAALASLRHAARSTWRIAALTSCTAAGERKLYIERVASVPLLIIDELGMRKLPATAAEDLLEIVMRRYERTSQLAMAELVASRRAPRTDPGEERAIVACQVRVFVPAQFERCAGVALGFLVVLALRVERRRQVVM